MKRILRQIGKWSLRLVLLVIGAAGILLFVAYWRSTNNCQQLAAAEGEKMKAIVYCDYGSPDVLKLMEVAKPVPNDNQLLVKVQAASVNPYDWHFIRGEPYIMRLGVGLRKPKNARLGVDFAGVVESVGKNITSFKAGDEVWGGKTGAFAEYVCVGEKGIGLKPSNISFEDAASADIAGLTALQAVRDKAEAKPGRKILINGASGGVGTFAVQIAKAMGAEVTGVCSTRNVDMVRALGADHVIDYTKEDFTKGGQLYDVILDNVGNQPLLGFKRALVRNGKYIMIGGGGTADQGLLGPMARPIKAMLLRPFVSQTMQMMMTDPAPDDYKMMSELMKSGKVKPVIDRAYDSLADIPDALRYLETGHARGKVVVRVGAKTGAAPPTGASL